MKLKVLKLFHDKVENTTRNVGDIIEVSDERGAEILASRLHVAELLEVGEPDAPQSGTEGESDSEGEPEETEPADVQLEQNSEGTEVGGEPAQQEKSKGKKNKK